MKTFPYLQEDVSFLYKYPYICFIRVGFSDSLKGNIKNTHMLQTWCNMRKDSGFWCLFYPYLFISEALVRVFLILQQSFFSFCLPGLLDNQVIWYRNGPLTKQRNKMRNGKGKRQRTFLFLVSIQASFCCKVVKYCLSGSCDVGHLHGKMNTSVHTILFHLRPNNSTMVFCMDLTSILQYKIHKQPCISLQPPALENSFQNCQFKYGVQVSTFPYRSW